MFRPSRCIIELSSACNLRCVTCALWKRPVESSAPDARPRLSKNSLLGVYGGLKDIGVRRVSYLGGEPFLNNWLTGTARDARKAGLITAVVTNGSAITDKNIDELTKQNAFDIMIFSIDGPRHVHDRIRGVPGTFDAAVATIKRIQKIRKSKNSKTPKIYIYMTVSSLNAAHIFETARIAQSLDAAAFKILSASCVDDAAMKRTNALFEKPVLLYHSYAVGSGIRLKKSPSNLKTQIKDVKNLAKRSGFRMFIEKIFENGRGAEECRFLADDFVISEHGDVCLCPMLPNLTIGNVFSDGLPGIFSDNHALASLNRIKELSDSGKLPVCGECCVEKLKVSKPSRKHPRKKDA